MYNDVIILQATVEEAKTQENAKLQSALQNMQLQFKEAKVMLMKEREIAKKAVDTIPVIQEVPVVDHEFTDKLASENEKLKVSWLKLPQVYQLTGWDLCRGGNFDSFTYELVDLSCILSKTSSIKELAKRERIKWIKGAIFESHSKIIYFNAYKFPNHSV